MNTGAIVFEKLERGGDSAVCDFFVKTRPAGVRLVDLYRWHRDGAPETDRIVSCALRSNGAIVGAVNVAAVPVVYRGRALRVAWQQDFVVDPSMRRRGLGRRLFDEASRGFDLVLAKGNADASYALLRGQGARDVPRSNFLVRILEPFASDGGPMRRALSPVLHTLARIAGRDHRQTSLATRAIERFDDAFDALSSRLASTTDLAPIKSRAYLDWRYATCPGRRYEIFRIEDAQQSLRGAAVMLPPENRGGTAWLVDIVGDPADREMIDEALNRSFRAARACGAGTLKVFATSARVRRTLFARGFVPTGQTPRFTYRFLGLAETANLTPDLVDWNFWHGDGDTELY